MAALASTALGTQASSHRESLAVLIEPRADNADTYAWVSYVTPDKLYLIMNFNPVFPFLAPAHQGPLQGYGGITVPMVPDIPVP